MSSYREKWPKGVTVNIHTLTESQSIVYGGGEDRGQRRKRGVRQKDRKSNGCFRVQPKSEEFYDGLYKDDSEALGPYGPFVCAPVDEF